MRRRTSVALVLAALTVLASVTSACVDVPTGVRAEFAPAGPGDRTNYRPGMHGTAPADSDAGGPLAGSDGGAV